MEDFRNVQLRMISHARTLLIFIAIGSLPVARSQLSLLVSNQELVYGTLRWQQIGNTESMILPLVLCCSSYKRVRLFGTGRMQSPINQILHQELIRLFLPSRSTIPHTFYYRICVDVPPNGIASFLESMSLRDPGLICSN
jgi:hypothetical protein